MTEPSLNKLKPEPLHTYEAKARCCLMCRVAFMSEWPGERVCRSCKTSKTWIAGTSPNHEYQ